MYHELNRLWPAERAYAAAAKAFDAAVKSFNGADESELDFKAIALAAAARLCGADPNAAKWATDRLQFALCVDPRRAHLRKLVNAFVVPGEAQRLYGKGRWRPCSNSVPTCAPPPTRCVPPPTCRPS
ncbi:hypothetical protein BZL30_0194 [Mycobacterium kansasii]|uniref:Uncharacterized protein n=1 Tax=Mycobacterium kansasii TaxID=1768 RepID=A0A1V3XSG6_MYCKA|nr:hypothetical protein BZL30_0194 [Mycobacterium kansasii]